MSDQLKHARTAVDTAAAVVDTAVARLAELSADGGKISVARLDQHQTLAYDLAHAAAAVEGSRVMCDYAEHGEIESMLARAYIADAIVDVTTRMIGRGDEWGIDPSALAPAAGFVAAHRAPAFLDELGEQCAKNGTGPSHLSDDFELVAETFRRFAEDKIRPVAEHVHRVQDPIANELR